MSESSDLLDLASQREEEDRAQSISNIIGKLTGPVEFFCEECGDEIPAERREAAIKNNMKAVKCVSCLSIEELRRKQGTFR